jgi:heme exporter protein D
MYFDSFAAFVQMGTHGPYVWSAYGFFALLVGFNLWLARRSERRARDEIRRLMRREQQGSL